MHARIERQEYAVVLDFAAVAAAAAIGGCSYISRPAGWIATACTSAAGGSAVSAATTQSATAALTSRRSAAHGGVGRASRMQKYTARREHAHLPRDIAAGK